MTQIDWRKSTYSRALGNCVEVGTGHALVAVRDSQDPGGPVIDVSPKTWTKFTKHVKRATSGHRGHRPSRGQQPA
jgi:Domain of unknown function (DUF397)